MADPRNFTSKEIKSFMGQYVQLTIHIGFQNGKKEDFIRKGSLYNYYLADVSHPKGLFGSLDLEVEGGVINYSIVNVIDISFTTPN